MELTREQQLEVEMLAIMAGDISEFARAVCGDVVTAEMPEFHKEIYDIITREEKVVIAAPRGFAKSTIISKIYPLWLALFRRRRDIVIISASESLATEHLRYIRNTVTGSEVVKRFWGDLKSEKWTESHIAIQHHDGSMVNLRAKGAGGQIRGYRPDCVIIDDLETDDSVVSEDQRRKLKDWLFKACMNCLLPDGQMLVIGTVLSQLSLLNDLLESPNGWAKRRYTAYEDGIQQEGHELWPKERPHGWLQARKAEIGSHRFSAEFMNDPVSDEDAPIKEEQIRYWEEIPKNLSAVIACDPAYSEDVKSDYKVAVLVGLDHQMNRYLLQYIRTHVPTGEYIQAILNMYMQHKSIITGLGVPSSGVEREFFRSVTNKAEELKVYPPFVELKNTFTTASGNSIRQKKQRVIAALQPLFENGKYFIGENHHEAREELLTIGNSRWDDLVDAMSYAEQILTPVYFDDAQKESPYAATSMAGACEGYGIEY